MVVGLEDAGFEIKDQIDWIYGSGFPKSKDISKAIDKKFLREKLTEKLGHKPTRDQFKQAWEYEREKIGEKPYTSQDITGNSYNRDRAKKRERKKVDITVPITSEAERWDGWGTALKPAHESIVVAQKPLKAVTYIVSITCLLKLLVKTVEKPSKLNLQELNEDVNTVLWNADENINTQGDLSEVTDISQLRLTTESIGLSMILSWKSIWEDILNLMNRSTISTVKKTTTDLKTLNSLLSQIILQENTEGKRKADGKQLNASIVEKNLKGVKSKLNAIQTLSAQGNATSKESKK